MKSYHYTDEIGFGKYKGLTIRQVYQGTLSIDSHFITNYLNEIFNDPSPAGIHSLTLALGNRLEFIEAFKVENHEIKVIGEIGDCEKPLTDGNRITFGNIQDELSFFISEHFSSNQLGILEHITSFNKKQASPIQLGGDPEYLEWCTGHVDGFDINADAKSYLENLPVARLNSFTLLYIGNDTYEYCPNIKVEKFKFRDG